MRLPSRGPRPAGWASCHRQLPSAEHRKGWRRAPCECQFRGPAVGIYSVLSYSVRRRVREIGIRMALGATPSDVLQMVVADGVKPILLGVGLGLAAAFALSRVVTSLIYGIRATDPLTFAGVALLLVAVGLLATGLPAYRATRVEPVKTLREE